MPDERYDRFFGRLMLEEGGLSNDPDDAGGLTKYGISHASYPDLDIKALTIDQAAAIYKRDYHDPLYIGLVKHTKLAYALFDAAVNIGLKWPAMFLQEVISDLGNPVAVDGRIGPVTLAALNELDGDLVLLAFCALRATYYMHLVEQKPRNKKFLEGWLRRTRRCLLKEV